MLNASAILLAILLATAPDAPFVVAPPRAEAWHQIPRPAIKPYGWSGLRVAKGSRWELHLDGRDSKQFGMTAFISWRRRL